MTNTHRELDPLLAYTYSDYDGESLTLRQQKRKWDHGSFVTVEYKGEGPVFLSSTDDVLRTALALIIRGADPDLPYVSTVVHGLRAAIKDIDDGRQYKRGQKVEVYDRHKEFGNRERWCKGEVMGYYDNGEYAVLPENCGVYISYPLEDIRHG